MRRERERKELVCGENGKEEERGGGGGREEERKYKLKGRKRENEGVCERERK